MSQKNVLGALKCCKIQARVRMNLVNLHKEPKASTTRKKLNQNVINYVRGYS